MHKGVLAGSVANGVSQSHCESNFLRKIKTREKKGKGKKGKGELFPVSSWEKISHLSYVHAGHVWEVVPSLVTQSVVVQMWSQATAVLSDAAAVEDHQLRKWWAVAGILCIHTRGAEVSSSSHGLQRGVLEPRWVESLVLGQVC